MQPTVSVIIPCAIANSATVASLASVSEQRCCGLEQIVIGDVDAIRRLLPDAFDDRCISWLPSRASNVVTLMNEATAIASGDVISWLLPGDLHFDDTLEIVRETFERNPQFGVLYGDALEIDRSGKSRRLLGTRRFQLSRLERGRIFSQPAAFVRRCELARVGPLDEQLRHWADYDLWLRLAAAGVQFVRVPRLLAAERHASASGQPFRRLAMSDLASADEFVRVLARRRRWVGRGPAAHLGLQRVLARDTPPVDFSTLCSEALREATLVQSQWNRAWLPSPWQRLLLAHRVAKVVRHDQRARAAGVDETTATPQIQRPKRFQMLRNRIHRLVHHEPRPLGIPATYASESAPPDAPMISIVTPSFNQATFLEATLRSVLDQRYPKLEYIVQDGGSTDGSIDVLRRHAHGLADWESRPDRGQTHAINLGMQRTTGSIMAYLNSDDVLLPGSLAYVARYFHEHPDVDIVYGHRVLIDVDGQEIGRWVLPPHDDQVIKYTDFIPQETMFWRRRAWEAVGGAFDESFRFALDWDIILRFQAAGLRFVRLPRFLGAFRISEAQKTTSWWLPVGRREVERLTARALGFTPDSSTVRRHIRHYMRQHYVYDKLYLLGMLRY
jgi:GT2 family glycosyltransferase